MQCCLALFALLTPRIVIVLLVVFSDWLGEAYETTVWPLLGFFFMPTTTLAYAWAVHRYGSPSGAGLVVVVVAVLIDFGLIGFSKNARGSGGGSDASKRRA